MSWTDWTIVLVALAIGFAVLIAAPPAPGWIDGALYGLIRVLLFSAIPLAALYWRVGSSWLALFHGFRSSYVWWGQLFGLINLLFTALLGAIAVNLFDLAGNALVGGLAAGVIPGGPLVFYFSTGLQLFGEEVITILPFLFLLWLGVGSLRLSRRAAVVTALLLSALVFGAMHLPTYDWNVAQALLMIGPVRVVLTLAYLKTKSLWASTIAHVFNDWVMFTLALVLGGMS